MAYVGRPPSNATLSSADIPTNSINSDHYVDASIDTAHIGNDQIDSQHYAAASIDNEHLADDAVGTGELANDVVISTSGAITTTGAFTSVGIDDNASGATAITIDSVEDVTFSRRILINTALDTSSRTFMVKDINTSSDSTYPILINASDSNNLMWLRGDGRLWVAETYDNSDINSKENISYISSASDIVNALKPATFDMKPEFGGGSNRAGFIAQDVEDVLPHAVAEGTSETNNMKSLNYNHIIPYLTKAIQELSVKNDALETENTVLKTRMDALEARVLALESA